MQQFLLKLTGLALVVGVMVFSACEDEPIITNPLGPDIQLVADPGFVDSNDDVEVGSAFDVKVTIFTGDAELNSVELFEGTTKLGTGRFTINGGAITTNNPFAVVGADRNGATYEFRINPGSQIVGDVTIYTIEVTDASGEKDAVDITINTVAPPGTPVDMTITGVLLNQAGPAGTGGLDLDTGTGTGSANADSEVRDLGIDCTINQNLNENWRAQFGTINGADMRKVDLTQVEGFTFEDAGTKESIQAAFDSGIALSDGVSTAPNCNETTVTDVSGTIAVDDLFVVFANNTYYLLRIDEVNYVHGPTANEYNDDNIVFSIKY